MSERPATYGDTTAEYLAAHRAGLVTGAHGLFWVEGPDAVSFLQGILTQDLEAMAAGSVARSLLLEPRGKLVDLLWLLRGEARVGLVTASDRLDHTVEELRRWRFRVDAELRIDERPVVEVWGTEAAATVSAAHPVPDGWLDRDGVLVARVPLGPMERVLVAGAEEPGLLEAGADRVGTVVADTVRIEAGEPRMGVDVDEGTIPQESGLVPASVSFTKGCYLGQELVARIDSRGRVNRHLRGLRILANVLPPVGAIVFGLDRELGTITSVGESLDLRAPIALGLIRHEAEPGTEVTIRWEGGEARARVEDLPMLVPA